MSAQTVDQELAEAGSGPAGVPAREPGGAPSPVEVRRNAGLLGAIGAAAAAMATAYLWRAVGGGGLFDWVLCAVLAGLAVAYLGSLLDARTPLLVADDLGVRARFGREWRGVPWEAVDRVAVRPRRGWLRDGRLVVALHHPARATEGLEGRARRQARRNEKAYGAALAVPLGLTTRVGGAGNLGDRVAVLSHGRTEVVALLAAPGQVVRPGDASAPASGPLALDPGQAPAPVGGRDDRGDDGPDDGAQGIRQRTPAPFRVVEAVRPLTAEEEASETPQALRGRVRRIAELRDAVEPVVVDEFEPQPAYDPVIGPELAAARTRVGLTVDELAERTRIRPHVIESIEVDDFAPCGGDFYARGHIRTLARMLGKDAAPLLAQFEQRYATAPVSARKVFEAELATGMTGTVRGGGLGGPNWALLVTAVLALVLVWSAVRLFAGEGDEVLETPPPVLAGTSEPAGGFGEVTGSDRPALLEAVVTAVNAGTSVEVYDGEGEPLFEGDLAIGERKRVEGRPPLTVSADNGGALEVEVAGRARGLLGAADEAATRVFQEQPD